MIKIHHIQRLSVLFKVGHDSIDKDKHHIFGVKERFFLRFWQLLTLEWFQIVTQLILKMSEGASNSIHLQEAFIKVKCISHEQTVEGEAMNWLCKQGLVHVRGSYSKQVD